MAQSSLPYLPNIPCSCKLAKHGAIIPHVPLAFLPTQRAQSRLSYLAFLFKQNIHWCVECKVNYVTSHNINHIQSERRTLINPYFKINSKYSYFSPHDPIIPSFSKAREVLAPLYTPPHSIRMPHSLVSPPTTHRYVCSLPRHTYFRIPVFPSVIFQLQLWILYPLRRLHAGPIPANG